MANGDSLAVLFPDHFYLVSIRLGDGREVTTIVQYLGLDLEDAARPIFTGYEDGIDEPEDIETMTVIREVRGG